MQARAKTILILGGGVGGLVAANRLVRALRPGHRIVLVDREADHLFAPSLLWLIGGSRRAEQIRRPLDRLRRKGIEVVRGEVSRIDPAARTVWVDERPLQGDFLILSLGADLAPEVVPGLAEGGHNLYTLDGAASFRDALRAMSSGRLLLTIASMPFKCPAAPYEAAMLSDDTLRRRGVRDAIAMHLYAAEAGPMGVAGPELSAAVRRMVEERGIAYHPDHALSRVDPSTRSAYFANGASAAYDVMAFVPPHRAPAVIREAGLTAESGWVPVNRETLETRVPGVYAIGDSTGIPLKLGKPLPKAGTFAHAQAEVVAHNIACQVNGRGEPRRFDGNGECFVEIGGGRAGFARGNFYAEPVPVVALRTPGRRWHWAKLWFEKYWLWRWF